MISGFGGLNLVLIVVGFVVGWLRTSWLWWRLRVAGFRHPGFVV